MKKLAPLLTILSITLISFSSFLVAPGAKFTSKADVAKTQKLEGYIQDYKSAFSSVDYNLEAFVKMTPKEFKKVTGKKLSVKETLQFKYAQKQIKKNFIAPQGEDTFPQVAYVILVVLGLGFIPLGILSDWKGDDWWVNLLLSVLCWLPGVIHGLVVMKKYY